MAGGPFVARSDIKEQLRSILKRRLPAGFILPDRPVERDKRPRGWIGLTKSNMTVLPRRRPAVRTNQLYQQNQ
jgi:hypothetical protein